MITNLDFEKNLSTCSAINILINSILLSFDKNNLVGGLFCDIHKAFDSVNHEILLAKLKIYGISCISNNLIRSYLTDRYQRVMIMNSRNTKTISSCELIRQGVPQGSVLGPLFFHVYINDLASVVEMYAISVLFADDTSIIISSPKEAEFESILSQVINDAVEWYKNNQLALNLGKLNLCNLKLSQNYN